MKKTAQPLVTSHSNTRANERTSKRGFTLIELLITISIIAVLAAIGAVVYSSAQKNGRISKRIQDLRSISAALEIYKTANGLYPNTENGANWNRSQCGGGGTLAQDQVIKDVVTPANPALVPGYMPALPQDPAMNPAGGGGGGINCYYYHSNGADYKIADLNIDPTSGGDMSVSDIQKQPQLIDPRWSGNQSICSNGTTTGKPAGWAIYTQNGPLLNASDKAGGAACF
jgi:prepilin-type N-terminal cleavage/methylation domain-containing protein